MLRLVAVLLCTLCSYTCTAAVAAAAADSGRDFRTFVRCLSSQNLTGDEISDIVYSPSNASFASVLQDYIRNPRFATPQTRKPSLIVAAAKESHVQAAVACAKATALHLKIRSGGHDYEGISYVSSSPFIILDMFNLRSIKLNLTDETAWVQSGATVGELYYRIWEKSKVHAFPGGVCPTMGIGGHVSGAGYGNMLRKFGLTVDNVVDARIVDAAGRVLTRETMGEDLFWAIRGGGGASFAVVVAYKLKLVRVPPAVTVFRVPKTLDENATDIFYQWQFAASKVDKNLFIRVIVQPTTKSKKTTVKLSFNGLYLGDGNGLLSVMKSQFPQLGLTKKDCLETSWVGSVLFWANFDNGTSEKVLLDRKGGPTSFSKRKSDYVQTPIPRDGLVGLWDNIIRLGKAGLAINAYGGKMAEVSESATPFPHRAGNIFKIQYFANWKEPGPEADKKYVEQMRTLYDYMTPYVSKNPREAFLNYRDLDIGVSSNGERAYEEAKVYGVKYFKGNFDRLVKIKTAADPENFFCNEQSIPPLPPPKCVSIIS